MNQSTQPLFTEAEMETATGGCASTALMRVTTTQNMGKTFQRTVMHMLTKNAMNR